MIGAATQPKTDLGYYKNLAEMLTRFPIGELGWSFKNVDTQTIFKWDGTTQTWIDSGEGFPSEESTQLDIKDYIGGEEIVNYDTYVEIGNSGTTILEANPYRTSVLLTNDSDEDIYISLSYNSAALNSGILLKPAGRLKIGYPKIYLGDISGICASGGKNLLVIEMIKL